MNNLLGPPADVAGTAVTVRDGRSQGSSAEQDIAGPPVLIARHRIDGDSGDIRVASDHSVLSQSAARMRSTAGV